MAEISLWKTQKTLRTIVRHVKGIERDCIIKRKKQGWFDKETYLHRIINNIGRLRQLGVPELEKKTALARCWKVYLDVQGMDDKNEVRDERKVDFNEVFDYTANTFDPQAVEHTLPDVRAHGRGFAMVNWNSIYLSKARKDLGHWWNPVSGKRDKHGCLLLLEDSEYWATKPKKGGK